MGAMNQKNRLKLCATILVVFWNQASLGDECNFDTRVLEFSPTKILLDNNGAPFCLVPKADGKIDSEIPVILSPEVPMDIGPNTVSVAKASKKVDDSGQVSACDTSANISSELISSTLLLVRVKDNNPDNVGKTYCFDISIADIGKLDPRAKVVDTNATMGQIAETQFAAVDAFLDSEFVLYSMLVNNLNVNEEEVEEMLAIRREERARLREEYAGK